MTFSLTTERLEILPLDFSQLQMQALDPEVLATTLGLVSQPNATTDPELQSALAQMIDSLEARPQDWPWNTNWVIISVAEKEVIGGCCFHGPPNPAGEVEVGYGLDPVYRGSGFMSEALEGLVTWAFSQAQVTAIIAETDKANLPSQRVLARLGMRVTRELTASLWWRLEQGGVNHTPACCVIHR